MSNPDLNSSSVDSRIAHYTDDRIIDPAACTELPIKDFHRARNRLLNACRQFGTIGPMDEFPLNAELSETEANRQWKSTGVKKPDFFVVDDQLNNERYIYVEVNSTALFSTEWINAVMRCLEQMKGWGIGITNLSNGYLILLHGIILVRGAIFDKVTTADSLIAAVRNNLH